MPIHTFDTKSLPSVRAVPLTPEGFAPFGGVISADHQIKNVQSSAANYGTAVKIHDVAPIVNDYSQSLSPSSARAKWNIFRCSAPKHLIETRTNQTKAYTAKVLERHPYSAQTFVPMGQLSSTQSYIVIVAQTDESTEQRLPDPTSLKAFICKGNQSVTYGQGIWHAPMVVIDENVPHVDFAVLIHENGVPDDDCQECYFDPGYSVEYQLHLQAHL